MNYILNIRDEDDKKVDKFKYTGVEVVKTSTPKKVKPLIKNTIETIIKKGDKQIIENLLLEIYHTYETYTCEDIAIPVSLNGYEKYFAKSEGFKMAKHTPIHVKSAIYHNLLLNKLGIDKKSETLKSGNKIKYMYVLPNQYNIETIAFLNTYPPEIRQIIQPNMKLMFEKTVLNPIQRILTAINWEIKNPLLEEKVNLLEFFG
jgi:hypothetical protein